MFEPNKQVQIQGFVSSKLSYFALSKIEDLT